MTITQSAAASASGAAVQPSATRRALRGLGIVLLVWLFASYFFAPLAWRVDSHEHPALSRAPRITHTHTGIHGDPLNLAMIGSELQLKQALLNAGWYPADPLTLKSCWKIAADTVLKRAYDDAPVSNLYLFGHKQQLAFEQPVGPDPRERHHVRWWRADGLDEQGRPLWFGSATFDRKVGFSHTTGQITHHIAADIDQERDHVIQSLENSGGLESWHWIDGFQNPPEGRNGGGDPWHTDGRLAVGVLAPELKQARPQRP